MAPTNKVRQEIENALDLLVRGGDNDVEDFVDEIERIIHQCIIPEGYMIVPRDMSNHTLRLYEKHRVPRKEIAHIDLE